MVTHLGTQGPRELSFLAWCLQAELPLLLVPWTGHVCGFARGSLENLLEFHLHASYSCARMGVERWLLQSACTVVCVLAKFARA